MSDKVKSHANLGVVGLKPQKTQMSDYMTLLLYFLFARSLQLFFFLF